MNYVCFGMVDDDLVEFLCEVFIGLWWSVDGLMWFCVVVLLWLLYVMWVVEFGVVV